MMEAIGSDCWAREPTEHRGDAQFPRIDIAAREFGDVSYFSDDYLDFPPTLYPGRELFTFGLYCPRDDSICRLGWWNLISLILAALI